jgi:hypothetical protein
LLHFVGVASWSDEKVLAKVREMVLPSMGPIEAWIIDDTGFPKQRVGWAKARSDVPTISQRVTEQDGGHGASAPLPTLRR